MSLAQHKILSARTITDTRTYNASVYTVNPLTVCQAQHRQICSLPKFSITLLT